VYGRCPDAPLNLVTPRSPPLGPHEDPLPAAPDPAPGLNDSPTLSLLPRQGVARSMGSDPHLAKVTDPPPPTKHRIFPRRFDLSPTTAFFDNCTCLIFDFPGFFLHPAYLLLIYRVPVPQCFKHISFLRHHVVCFIWQSSTSPGNAGQISQEIRSVSGRHPVPVRPSVSPPPPTEPPGLPTPPPSPRTGRSLVPKPPDHTWPGEAWVSYCIIS